MQLSVKEYIDRRLAALQMERQRALERYSALGAVIDELTALSKSLTTEEKVEVRE